MAYIINKTNGQQLVILQDGTLDTSTSMGLVGRNYTGYGEIQNENFVGLLESFANNNPPPRPLSGQVWFNTTNNTLNVYNGELWSPVGSATISNNSPLGINGTFWYKEVTNQLFVYYDGTWNLVGPEGAEGFGVTKIRSRQILDNLGAQKIILEVMVDDTSIAVISKTAFQIADETPITGYSQLVSGITMASGKTIRGNIDGNATTATRLETGREINGIVFDGQNNITITANTTRTLTKGAYLTGSNFNGSVATTWSVDASSSNMIGKVVARDSAGDFSAGTITANIVGDLSGNVSTSTGVSSFNIVQANEFIGATLSGNALTANKLKTARNINNVSFDGTQDITVTADAATLTGTSLAPNITNLGILNDLNITEDGLTIGTSNQFKMFLDGGTLSTIRDNLGLGINLDVYDPTQPTNLTNVSLISSTTAVALGGLNAPAFIPDATASGVMNLGLSTVKWNNVYANYFNGTATAAQYADLAENYLADAEYEPGTVLEFGGDKEVTLAQDETRRIAGVVSKNPAYLMNSELKGEHVVALALQGRVPCKVRGKIHKGDMLVSGGGGYARPAVDAKIGTVIGKALQDFEGSDGIIEIVVGRI